MLVLQDFLMWINLPQPPIGFQSSDERALHEGGAHDVAPADKACLRMRALRPVWLLVRLPALQDCFILW